MQGTYYTQLKKYVNDEVRPQTSSERIMRDVVLGLRYHELHVSSWNDGTSEASFGCLSPFIHIEYIGKPEYRIYENQEELFRKYAKKYSTDFFQLVRYGEPLGIWKEVMEIAYTKPHTSEFLAWFHKQKKQEKILKKLLSDYYMTRLGISKNKSKNEMRIQYYYLTDRTLRLEFFGTVTDVCDTGYKETVNQAERNKLHKKALQEFKDLAKFLVK